MNRILIITFMLTAFTGFSQVDYWNLKKGVSLYSKKDYSEAEAKFKKVIEHNDTIMEAYFDLGNTSYEQERFEESRENYNKVLNFCKDKDDKAEVFHNIGNTYMAENKWEEAIGAFKNSLKNDSKDLDTKYNLAYSEKMLAKQQQQQKDNKEEEEDKSQKEQKDNKDKKDGNSDKENGDKKDSEKKDDKDGEKDEEEQKKDSDDGDKKDKPKEEQNKEGKPKPTKLSKAEAERLLKAIESQEQKLQDKKKREDMELIKTNSDKDW